MGYCPLIWVNDSRSLNNKINRIHERAPHVVYRDKKSTFDEFFEKGTSVKIHLKYLEVFVTEIFNVQNETSVAIITIVFPIFLETTVTLNLLV